MKKLIIILLCPIFLSSCDEDSLCLKGSGTVNEYDIPTNSFDKISLYGPVNLSIKQSDEISVKVLAEPEMYYDLEHSVRNGNLKIGYMDNVKCFDTDEGVWINIEVPDLTMINTNGNSIVVSDGELHLNNLEINVDGIAEVTLSGSVRNQEIDVDGSADIHNFHFFSINTYINVDGSADIEVSVSSDLDIDVDGSARVKYSGQPHVTKKVSGLLDLDRLN